MSQKNVLVTGGSGFIAGHCILQLLEAGHLVRASIRTLAKEAAVRHVLEDAGMNHAENLSFVAADLLSDEGWGQALADVDSVLHVASPVHPGYVANEDDLIIPLAKAHCACCERRVTRAPSVSSSPQPSTP